MNIKRSLDTIDNYFSPKIIGEINDQYIKVVKIRGKEVPWHNHENEDELFFIVGGSLLMETENQDPFPMKTGDLFTVGKGLNHRISSTEDCLIMLIESKTTEHTGKVMCRITKSLDEQK